MSQFMRWLAMGGYAIYIWPTYALVCGVLITHVLIVKAQRVRVRKKLHQWFKRQ
ncbi:heme exporter protein CcmD [Legionella lansingensis]|uniref:Heme exporter protein D n=1 Tax=Legionella lansingensis TaxID=45067 RepID=A0A0W0VYW4_9GAMM|nr:heme exporter protein CcmD [Legionella lansingensis]KTD25476.1 heme exporter protein CcmD [Legionella lansingensis]SNV51517.1 heme exporter protein CcmD [Legionella lansingensis]